MRSALSDQARGWVVLVSRVMSERGQTMAEYGILIAVIAIVVVAAALFLGGGVTNLFRNTGSHL